MFVKIGPHIYNFALLVHAELDARVEDQSQPSTTMAGGPRWTKGVALTFAAPIGLSGTTHRLELQGVEAEAVQFIFNAATYYRYGRLGAGEILEIPLPGSEPVAGVWSSFSQVPESDTRADRT